MPTLGEELKQRRERRGVTLAEIAESTRIGTRFLKAIETDNFSILPGGIFTRSFIRAYAKHVGMNEDEAVGLYLQQVSGTAPEQPEVTSQPAASHAAPIEKVDKAKKPPAPVEPVARQTVQPPERSRRFEPVAFRPSPSRTSWPTIVIGGGIVVFIIIIVLALVKQLNQGASDDGAQATSPQKDSPPKAAPVAPPETAPGTPAPSGSASSKPVEPSTPASAPEGQPLVVKIEAATGDSWVKYKIDDSKPTTLVLKQGQSQDLPPAQMQVTLNYGNRLTLKLKINNRDANFPPDTPKFASQVVISRENFQTFFQ